MKSPDYKEFVQPNTISIWLGHFTDESDLSDYLGNRFPIDYGLNIPTHKIGEIWAEPKAVSILDLVKDFSQASKFQTKCIEMTSSKGISSASCMFIAYNFKYNEEFIVNSSAPMTFIGAITYQ